MTFARLMIGLTLFVVANIVPMAHAADFQPLFNGTDLTGWESVDGPAESWKVEGEVLFCSGGGGGWLSTTREYANFELELEFRVPPGGNSGVFLRAPREGNPAFAGMEIQVLDDAAEQYAALQPYQYCGSLYGVVAATPRVTKAAGEWQKMAILCEGRYVRITLNDTTVVDANLDDHQDQAGEHPGIGRTSGYIGLQNHGTRLDYRNVRIRELP